MICQWQTQVILVDIHGANMVSGYIAACITAVSCITLSQLDKHKKNVVAFRHSDTKTCENRF